MEGLCFSCKQNGSISHSTNIRGSCASKPTFITAAAVVLAHTLPVLDHAGQCSHFLDLAHPLAVNRYRKVQGDKLNGYVKINTSTVILVRV
jgi:hypothetical protein